jgi:hypothetical protein
MPALEHYLADDVCSIAFWNNVALVDVWADVDAAHMRKFGDAYRKLLTRNPPGIVVLVLIRSSTPVSSAEARAESTRFLKELGDSILHTAMVIEAQGVLAMMLKSVVRSLNVLLRNPRISLPENAQRAIATIAPLVVGSSATGNMVADLTKAVAELRAVRRLDVTSLRATK